MNQLLRSPAYRIIETPFRHSDWLPVQLSTLTPVQAVFFHIATKPIKLLTVPAIPTMPSSRLTHPSAEVGTVRSHRSEMSCSWLADRSL